MTPPVWLFTEACVFTACSAMAAYMQEEIARRAGELSRVSSQSVLSGVQGMDGLKWLVGDMLDLQVFQSGAFNAVIEKGTMDVLFVDNDSPWDPSTAVRDRVFRMLDEVHR